MAESISTDRLTIRYANAHQSTNPVSYTHLDVYKRQAPSSAEAGMSLALPLFIKCLAIWGIISPMKLKSPAKLTAAPARSAAAKSSASLIIFTLSLIHI